MASARPSGERRRDGTSGTSTPLQDEDEHLSRLLQAVAKHDRSAFGSLYDATAPKLYGLVLRITRNRALAQEVLQDAFLNVWRRSETFDRRVGRPFTWLASIAHHAAIDAVRRRDERTPRDELSEDLPDTRQDLSPEVGLALRSCLGELADEDRSMVVLAYCEGWSRDELARRTDHPTGTIKTRLRRALQSLRECLDR